MKLLFLVQNFRQGWGGGPESVRLMAQRLRCLGVSSDVVDRGRLWRSVEQMDVLPKERANTSLDLGNLDNYRGICHVGPWQDPRFVMKVLRYKESRTPLFYLPRGGLAQIEFTGAKRLKKIFYWLLIERKFVNSADTVVFSSQAEAHKLDGIVRCIDDSVIIPDYFTAEKPWDVTRGPRLSVAFLAEISHRKGLVPLLRGMALANLPVGTCLEVAGGVRAGEEAYFAEAKALIASCDRLNINYLGGLPHDQRNAFYGRTDIFVVASLFESFGLTALEALAAGCHLVCTPDCGVLEYLPDSRWVTRASSHTPEAIAEALEIATSKIASPDHSREAISAYSISSIDALNQKADIAWTKLLNL